MKGSLGKTRHMVFARFTVTLYSSPTPSQGKKSSNLQSYQTISIKIYYNSVAKQYCKKFIIIQCHSFNFETNKLIKSYWIIYGMISEFANDRSMLLGMTHRIPTARLLHLTFTSGDRTILAKAFTIYVRPLLEYCSPVWNPHLKYLIQGIESVQRRFTKAILSLRHQPYSARLKILGFRSLEYRRLISDLCFLFKLLNGLVKSDL